MLNSSEFRDLVSGRRRGPLAGTLRFALRLAEVPYSLAIRGRNWCYDSGMAATYRISVPVVSIGNLTLGGTGKTPMVVWLGRWFRSRDVRPAVISRGYGASAGAQNDEALELKQKLPDVPHLQDPDRVAAARAAVEEYHCQVILLDDALQHRRIGRDLEIVLLDALEPFGFGHVFPRGTLREPLSGLRRADVVALSRADVLRPAEREEIWRQVRRYAPQSVYLETAHVARTLISSAGQEEPLESLAAQPVAAFCGIGNPAAFRHTLQTCGYHVADFREFPDHHRYTTADIDSLARWANRLEVAAVLCTQKDLVKLDIDQLGRRPLRAVRVELTILTGRDALEAKLRTLLPRQS